MSHSNSEGSDGRPNDVATSGDENPPSISNSNSDGINEQREVVPTPIASQSNKPNRVKLSKLGKHHPSLESSPLLSNTRGQAAYGGQGFATDNGQTRTGDTLAWNSEHSRRGVARPPLPVVAESRSSSGIPSMNPDLHSQETEPTTQEAPLAQRGKALWGRLKEHVDKGEFLLGEISESRNHRHRQSLHWERQQEIRSGMNFSVGQCVMAIAVYEVLSIIFYSEFLEPEWTFIDSSYFAVTTFTTVGYGDLAPTTKLSKLFTCFYALTGVACLGLALGVIGGNLIENQVAVEEDAVQLNKLQAMTLFDYSVTKQTSKRQLSSTDRDIKSNENAGHDDKLWQQAMDRTLRNTELTSTVRQTAPHSNQSFSFWTSHRNRRFLVLLVPLTVMAYLIGADADWDFISTLYYLVVTACTIGYGDFTPKTQGDKIMAILFIPLACGVAGAWLSFVASYIIEQHSMTFRKTMQTKELSLEDLYIMDEDGDGDVTRAEFLEFMLVAMNKIDEDLVDELREYFHRLDCNGSGVLNRQCLVHEARKKLRHPRRKLELAMYKQKLHEQAETADLRNRNRPLRAGIWEAVTSTMRRFSFIDSTILRDSEHEEFQNFDSMHSRSQAVPIA